LRVVVGPGERSATRPTLHVEQFRLQVVAEASSGDVMHWVQVGIPDAQTSLTLVNWFNEMPPGSLRALVIDCESLDNDYRKLVERGVRFIGAPEPSLAAYSPSSPIGNRISLRQGGR
jgi:hypothetical protein